MHTNILLGFAENKTKECLPNMDKLGKQWQNLDKCWLMFAGNHRCFTKLVRKEGPSVINCELKQLSNMTYFLRLRGQNA
jgi:hypothetical protein